MMSGGSNPVGKNGLTPEPAVVGAGAVATGHTAPAAGPFCHCPVPTLEGQSRFSASGPTPFNPDPTRQAAPAQPARKSVKARRRPALPFRHEDDFLLRLYCRDALKEPPLAEGEESEMAWRASFGDGQGRDRLVLGNLGLVMRIASEYEGLGLCLSDLISEGNLGLMRALELYRPTEAVPFQVYASVWIRQHMRRALTRQAWPMRLPANFSWQHSRLRHAEERLASGTAREPADEELAAECGLSPSLVRRLRADGFPRSVSLQSPVSGCEDDEVLADTLPDEQIPRPDVATSQESDREYVEDLLADLKPRERQVLRLRFGLDDGQERTLEEVGLALGYVRQGVHKIESAALTRIRRRTERQR